MRPIVDIWRLYGCDMGLLRGEVMLSRRQSSQTQCMEEMDFWEKEKGINSQQNQEGWKPRIIEWKFESCPKACPLFIRVSNSNYSKKDKLTQTSLSSRQTLLRSSKSTWKRQRLLPLWADLVLPLLSHWFKTTLASLSMPRIRPLSYTTKHGVMYKFHTRTLSFKEVPWVK